LKKLLVKYDYLLIGIVAFAYYSFLSAKEWTWIFTSSDSGDWLASSIWWMNSQPYGSPLYVLLGHLLNWLFPQHLILAMTIGLSVIPASITVAITYLIIKKLSNIKYAIAGSLILLSSAIFLSQSTVIEEYAIATMFLTLAYYFYIQDKKKLILLMLGLGSAIHIIIALISFIWLLFHLREIKLWYKKFWIYLVFGILPYSLVLILMASDTPKLIAGNLSLASFNNYLGSSSTIGSISWYEAIFRLPNFIEFMCLSLGLGIVAFISMLKRPYTRYVQIAIITIIITMWLYFTNVDPSTWTFLTFSTPLMAVLVGIGLQKFNKIHYNLVSCFAIILIVFNTVFLNANILTKEVSLAKEFEIETWNLPDHSAIIETSGGAYGLGTIYIMAKGKDIIPIYYSGDLPNEEFDSTARYNAYKTWLDNKYAIQGTNTQEQVRYALNSNVQVYIVKPMIRPAWQNIFQVEDYSKYYDKVIGVN
jgi:hypothetical protein